MRSTVIFIGGLVSGYIAGNIKYKEIGEIIEDISNTVQSWLEVTREFVGTTANGLEGFDSDQIQINIEAFLNAISSATDNIMALETTEEKLSFIEEEISKVTDRLVNKSGK